MFTPSLPVLLAAALLLWLGQSCPATAGKPKDVTFEELVAKADFVGIVECEAAGLPIGKFKVIDSCRGPKAGERIHFGRDVYYFAKSNSSVGHVMPLCGQRYLLTVRRARNDGNDTKGVSGPLAWRQIPIDFAYGWSGGLWENPDPKLFAQAKQILAGKPQPQGHLPQPAGLDLVMDALTLPLPTEAVGQTTSSKKANATRDRPLPDDLRALVEQLINSPPENPKDPRVANFSAYTEASHFGWKCGQDRQKYLQQLLTAKDPVVRVAGAVYLCFDNEKLGIKELAKLTDLEGEAGAWAALTLARRGQKSALPRVLDVFIGAKPNVLQWQLRLRAIELLSNSAHKSGLVLPTLPAHTDTPPSFQTLQQWWQQNAERVTLHDPWLDYLAKQKID